MGLDFGAQPLATDVSTNERDVMACNWTGWCPMHSIVRLPCLRPGLCVNLDSLDSKAWCTAYFHEFASHSIE